MKLDLRFVEACQKIEEALDGVIEALTWPKPNPKTVVTYQGETVQEYLIEGELGQNSIPNKSNAVKVKIGTAVTSIGNSAFAECYKLMSVTIPDSVTSINTWAFYNCSGLTSITIGNNVTSIGEYAFCGCSGLMSITIPDSVTNIDDWAFSSCSSITSIIIPDSVTSIEIGVFFYCSSLISITVDSNNPIYDSRNNCNAIIKKSNNELIASCKNTVIPDSVTSIGDWAFYDCSGLTSVTIPNSVTSIGDYAFWRCSSLSSIICQATTAPTVQSNTFGSNSYSYTGYPTRGNNVLKVPANAMGYNSGTWADPLQNSTKCGFHIEYL